MAVNALAFDSLRSAERLAFALPARSLGSVATMCFGALFLAFGTILTGKMFTDDFTAVAALISARQVMTIQCIGVLGFMAWMYWLTSSTLLRVTHARKPWADIAYGALFCGPTTALFYFAYTQQFDSSYMTYVYAQLPLFVLGGLAASFFPWLVTIAVVIKQKRPFWLWLLAGLMVRLVLLAALVIVYLLFTGTSLYDPAVTKTILSDLGFGSSLKGFLTVLVGLFIAACFALIVTVLTCSVMGADTFFRSTAAVKRSLLVSASVTCLIGLVYAVRAVSSFSPNLTVWLSFGLSFGLACAFLGMNLLLKVRHSAELIRALVVCFELLLLITLSFAVQYFGPGSDRQRNLAFLMTMPGILLTCAHLIASRVASGPVALRSVALLLSAIGSAALAYVILVENGYAELLPAGVPIRSLFNFIIISAVIFFAIYACARLLLATNGGTRLMSLRAAGRKVRLA